MATVADNKVLIYGKDLKVEQERMVVEFLVWDCPHCNRANRSLEFYIEEKKLWCGGCHTETSFKWE